MGTIHVRIHPAVRASLFSPYEAVFSDRSSSSSEQLQVSTILVPSAVSLRVSAWKSQVRFNAKQLEKKRTNRSGGKVYITCAAKKQPFRTPGRKGETPATTACPDGRRPKKIGVRAVREEKTLLIVLRIKSGV